MEVRKKLISEFVLKLIVGLSLLVVSIYILTVSARGDGLVVNRVVGENGDKVLIYSQTSQVFLWISSIVSGLLTMIGLVWSSVQFKRLIQNPEDNNSKRDFYIQIVGSVVLFGLAVSNLMIFPLDYDKYNYYGFGLSIAMAVITLTYVLYVLYLNVYRRKKSEVSIAVVTEGAMMAALAIVLSLVSKLIPGLELPQGGSFSLSMLPLFIFGLRRGPVAGFMAGLTYGFLNFITDGFIIHWGSIFFDYLLPFSLLTATAGLFSKKARNGNFLYMILPILLGAVVRYVFHGFSGVIFFAEYAGDQNVYLYSFIVYNLPYMAVSTLGCLILGMLLHRSFVSDKTKIM